MGYFERSRGFKFYDPSNRSFSEIGNPKFIEDVDYGGNSQNKQIVFEEVFDNIDFTTENDMVILPNIFQPVNQEYIENTMILVPNISQPVD